MPSCRISCFRSELGERDRLQEVIAENEQLRAEVERLGRCHRIVAKQAGFYKPDLPDFYKVDIHLGVLRAAARCAGLASWEDENDACEQKANKE